MQHREYEDHSQAFKRAQIAVKARTNPKVKFNNLLHHLTPELIKDCLLTIPLNSAIGVDKLTVKEVRGNLDWLLPPILKQIHEGGYIPPPVRRVYIPKADGRKRPLGIPTVLDRAIQAGMTKILNEIYEQDFLKCSYGFRPELGCHNALMAVGNQIYRNKTLNCLEVDIRDFFGSLSHGWLMKFLEHRISDKRVLKLIKSWLTAGVLESEVKTIPDKGTPQGGVISPLLANIYLHYVLDLWWEKKIKPGLNGKAELVRYCDDFVILFQDREDLIKVECLLKARLEQFTLEIADEKTHTTDLRNGKDDKSKLRRRHITFLGFSIYRALNQNKTGYKVVFQTEKKRLSKAKKELREKIRKGMHLDLETQVKRINSTLRGHYNYYGLPGNSYKLGSFYNHARKSWKYWLSNRSQNGYLNWKKAEAIFAKYPLVFPILKIKYSDIGRYLIL